MNGKTSIDTTEDRNRILLESTPLVPWEADARTTDRGATIRITLPPDGEDS